MIADQPKKSVGNCGQDSARNKQQSTHYYQVAIVAQVPQALLEASYIVSYKGKTRDSPQKQSKVQARKHERIAGGVVGQQVDEH